MRINQFVAQATGLSRRATDKAIAEERVRVNDAFATLGQNVSKSDSISLDGNQLVLPTSNTTILIDKPTGYVCSRDGQGAPTIYDLVPSEYASLKHVGRLDKDSSGLVILTDDGTLAHELSHPSFNKSKQYFVRLDRPLESKDQKAIEEGQINLDNKPSRFAFKNIQKDTMDVVLNEGRNRQIRRTFTKLNYNVIELRREKLGPYSLSQLKGKQYIKLI